MKLKEITRRRIRAIEKSDKPFTVIALKDGQEYIAGNYCTERFATLWADKVFQSDALNVSDADVWHINDVSREY